MGEKLRLLEEMVAATKVISATRPPKPENAVRLKTCSRMQAGVSGALSYGLNFFCGLNPAPYE